ncbi:MAG: DUF6888 family protein [Chroococcales cyanobacterium]
MSEKYYNLPTHKQSNAAIFLLHLLSTGYQPIHFVRYDPKYKTLYIQAGVTEEIAILIDEEGTWEFV